MDNCFMNPLQLIVEEPNVQFGRQRSRTNHARIFGRLLSKWEKKCHGSWSAITIWEWDLNSQSDDVASDPEVQKKLLHHRLAERKFRGYDSVVSTRQPPKYICCMVLLCSRFPRCRPSATNSRANAHHPANFQSCRQLWHCATKFFFVSAPAAFFSPSPRKTSRDIECSARQGLARVARKIKTYAEHI